MLETNKQDLDYLILIQEQLKSENFEMINFDKLILHLGKVKSLYDNYQLLHEEYHTLQSNLIEKIKVMKMATEVVSKKRPEINREKLNSEELKEINSSDLLEIFEQAEVKFHATFPSTFSVENNYKKQYKDYKSYK